MSGERIAVGIAGLGRSGWNIHADGFDQLADRYRVAAVADPLPERQEEAAARFSATTYDDPEKLISDPDLDLVVVATPSATHAPLGVAALRAGKHVVVEKPMAQSGAEIDQLNHAATDARRVVTCFQNNRFEPSFAAVREVIDSGRIGEVSLIRRVAHRYARRADWQTLRELGGGELPNTTSHTLDQLLMLLGDTPIEVFADLRRTVSAGDAEDHVKLILRPQSGPVIDIETSSGVAWPQQSWLVAGAYGGITGTPTELQVRWLDPASLAEITANKGPAAGRMYGTGENVEWREETIQVPAPSQQRTLDYYEHLYATLREGAELFVTPESVRRQIEIIAQARQQTGYL